MIRKLAEKMAAAARTRARKEFSDVPESELLTTEDVVDIILKQRAGPDVFKSVDGAIWPVRLMSIDGIDAKK